MWAEDRGIAQYTRDMSPCKQGNPPPLLLRRAGVGNGGGGGNRTPVRKSYTNGATCLVRHSFV